MFNGMTIWAKHLKVFQRIVEPIPIFMMHTKNAWLRIILTSSALINHISFKHDFANSRKCWRPNAFLLFTYTFLAAKLSILRFGCKEFFFAMLAFVGSMALALQRFIITLSTAIFSLITSRRYMSKMRSAHLAICFNFRASRKPKAFQTTIFSSFFPIFRKAKNSVTMLTVFFHGGSYALS